MEKTTISVQELSAQMGISLQKAYELVKSPGFPTIRVGTRILVPVARWIQCEDAISEFGFLAKHPTTGAAITSPYVAMSTNYMKQINQQWAVIFSIVKENCSDLFDHDSMDPMEALLRSRLPK